MRLSLLVLAITTSTQAAQAKPEQLPPWVVKLIASQPRSGGDVIEQSSYKGRRVFEILSRDRGDDTGNEHVLHAEDGHIICEYGGFGGHVSVGSCEINQIKYVRTLFPRYKQ